MNHALAAKALLINPENNVLVLRRSDTDTHDGGAWDIPGGRLNDSEDPALGVVREVLEESGISIPPPETPVGIHHFTRDDGQGITMIVYVANVPITDVVISHEHTEYAWVDISSAQRMLNKNYHNDIERAILYLSSKTS